MWYIAGLVFAILMVGAAVIRIKQLRRQVLSSLRSSVGDATVLYEDPGAAFMGRESGGSLQGRELGGALAVTEDRIEFHFWKAYNRPPVVISRSSITHVAKATRFMSGPTTYARLAVVSFNDTEGNPDRVGFRLTSPQQFLELLS